MKLATELYDEAQKDRGMSRMIVLSAVLHVVVIGALLVTGHLRFARSPEPLSTSYEVTLVGPTGTGKRKITDEKLPGSLHPSTAEKVIAPLAREEQREALPPKPEAQVQPQQQEKPKLAEQVRPKIKEPLTEKPREVRNEIEPPKPRPAPVVKEKEPSKVLAAAKPIEKPPPPLLEKKIAEVPVKEPIKPRVEARLLEKKEKPQEKPLLQPERAKVAEKKPDTQKPEEKPKAQTVPLKLEKKPAEPVKMTAKEKVNEPKKTENVDTPRKQPTVTVPTDAKAPASDDASQTREDKEARDRLITSAVERVRGREESTARERDIAKAVDRVRQDVGGREDRGRETEKQPATSQTSHEKEDGDGRVVKAKVHGPEFLAYTESIKQKVKEGWIVTDHKPGLTAVVQFGVESGGEVVGVELVESSGDRSFDQSTLRAVRNAKLPPPPEMYREEFSTQKVHMTFGGEE